MFQTNDSMPITLNSLELKNFKCFSDATKIEFGKLTILTGANSSGKSSIVHAILGSAQSSSTLVYSTNGKYVNMGDFEDISYNKNPNSIVEINYSFDKSGERCSLASKWKINRKNKLMDLHSFEYNTPTSLISCKKIKDSYSVHHKYEKGTSEKEAKSTLLASDVYTFLSQVMDKPSKKSNTIKGDGDNTNLHDLYKVIDETFSVKNLDDRASYRFTLTLHEMANIFKNYDKHFNVISSFRLHPNRVYLEKSLDETKVGKFGEGYLDQILIWELNKDKRLNELKQIMKKLSLIYALETKRLGGGRFEILVTTKPKGVKTSISDVGFGISQFLPIIVADLQLPKESTLFIAQPEIHLHPSAQAEFGTYLTSQIQTNNKNYIVETHSEYFLNRIRLNIVKGDLKEEDLKVYYLQNDGNKSVAHEVKFTKDGQVLGAPDSFFDTYYIDVKNIALNILE